MREKQEYRDILAEIKIDFGDIKMLTVQQAAELLQCDRRTIVALIESRKLTAVDIATTGVNKQYRIPAASLARFITKEN
jgi:excisionase family DNA binding protein